LFALFAVASLPNGIGAARLAAGRPGAVPTVGALDVRMRHRAAGALTVMAMLVLATFMLGPL
jgi:hypothetical protein